VKREALAVREWSDVESGRGDYAARGSNIAEFSREMHDTVRPI
jgi:hypothetical protein